MPWARIDDTLCDHPKTMALLGQPVGLASLGLLTLLLSWSNRHLTDGHFSDTVVKRLGGKRTHVEALAAAGFVETDLAGWLIHDFAAYSPSRDKVESDRAAWRGRQAKSRRDNGVTHP
jgi:hypothetical protein